jgi:peptide/nickel transport system substrate-binding protein
LVGLTGGGAADTMDAQLAVTYLDYCRVTQLYDTLVRLNPDFTLSNSLAVEIVPNEIASECTIRVKKGLTFHDGRTLTADDVLYSFQRIVDPKKPLEGAGALAPFDLGNARKLDKFTLRIPCTRPFSILQSVLMNASAMNIVPRGYDPKKPVGTGPFKYQSFDPGVQSTFVRNDDYFVDNRPYADTVVISDYADEASAVNALISGKLNALGLLSVASVSGLRGAGQSVTISDGGGWVPFTMRVDTPPFDDPKVRQAFRLIVDREEMRKIAYGGYGLLGNDVFAITDPQYDHSLPQREQDIDQAKSLLSQAGKDGLKVDLMTADFAPGAVSSAQVFAQQAKQAGVDVNIRKLTVSEFYGPNYLSWTFAMDYWGGNFYLAQGGLSMVPGATSNETHWNNARYNDLYKQAMAETDYTKQTAIAHEMCQIDYEQGGYIVPSFAPAIDANAPQVHGLGQSKSGLPLANFNLKDLWIS